MGVRAMGLRGEGASTSSSSSTRPATEYSSSAEKGVCRAQGMAVTSTSRALATASSSSASRA
eukprot:CAMPEP_0173342978 /NCGR_PEP_ID=MMETSP1144-20121109/10529_1 /TAXON_ID=483371 /ORGANISM="non described non described, Strain CCMP2298" /LENGTH=61 /DNA_ID=CAMNT_0014289675 /DNA_START=560 /DNA_END=745 /DNA_ORIENTATION=-